MPSKKHDQGKPPVYSLLEYFPDALIEVAKVNAFGATNHGWHTWHTIDNPLPRYASAQLRHEFAQCMGQPVDEESGLLHQAHVAWNALARLQLMLYQLKEEIKAHAES